MEDGHVQRVGWQFGMQSTKQGINKCLFVENLELFDSFTDPDVSDRNFELIRNAQYDQIGRAHV